MVQLSTSLDEQIEQVNSLLTDREFVLDSYKPGRERLYRMEELRKTATGKSVVRTYPRQGRLIAGMMRKYLEGFVDGAAEVRSEEQPP